LPQRTPVRAPEPVPAKPILRWVGGKTRLVDKLVTFLPPDAALRTYHEPFLGGGSMFFSLRPQVASISDANAHLVWFYEEVRKNPDRVYRVFSSLCESQSAASYYEVRGDYNRSRWSAVQAARFLYLNKYAFNGIFRVNKKGEFNVPFGRRERYSLPAKEQFRAIADALRPAALSACSYVTACERIRRDDFAYLDPPYPPINGTSFFTHYTADRFSTAEQVRLAEEYRKLDARGALLLMTNADVPLIRELYGEFNLHRLQVTRFVTCKSRKHSVSELVVTNYDCCSAPRQERTDKTGSCRAISSGRA
jgi:DNA adenine methylase